VAVITNLPLDPIALPNREIRAKAYVLSELRLRVAGEPIVRLPSLKVTVPVASAPEVTTRASKSTLLLDGITALSENKVTLFGATAARAGGAARRRLLARRATAAQSVLKSRV
jgi:hypothetical protein